MRPRELAHCVQREKHDQPRRCTPDVTAPQTGPPVKPAASDQRDLSGSGGVTTVSTYQAAGRYAESETRNMKMPRFTLLLFRLVLCLLLAPVRSRASDSVDSVEKAATEWIKTRAETVRLETEWASQRELLESTVNALSERAKTIEDKRDNLKAKTIAERTEFATLQEKNQVAADRIQATDARLKELRDRLIQLRPSLPPRLSEALELPYRSLAGTELGPSERMQITMTVLNRCAQFNRMVTCGQEVLTIEGEPGPKSLEVIYWGLSRGYALDQAAGKVWLGAPGPKGWQWEAHPEAFPQVARLIAVYNDKSEPEFIAVPAKLGHVATATSNR
jgi:Protein of unknown function (DUF3450)